MYIKMIGGLALIGLTSAIGFIKAGELNERVRKLQNFKRMIIFLQGELRFHRSVLSEAFENVGEKMEPPFSEFLKTMAEELEERENDGFESVWEKNSDILLCEDGFRKEDKILLEILKSGLGYLDLTMQTETLNAAVIRTEEAIAESQEQLKTKGKLYQTMGVTIGALLTLLII